MTQGIGAALLIVASFGCSDLANTPPVEPTNPVVPPGDCDQTCASLDFACGEVCGQVCGSCADDQVCTEGQCSCRPTCDGTRCSDGCGGVCACDAGTVCRADDQCVAPVECTDTCGSAGRACGEVCGASCGTCGGSESCIAGACVEGVSCSTCSLRLRLTNRLVEGGRLRRVTLEIEYAPSEDEPRPRLADFRIRADRRARLVSAEAGDALVASEKELYVDEITGRPWKIRDDGSFQLLAYGFANTRSFDRGVLLTLTFDVDEAGPVTFSLVRREQTFAPADADAALLSTEYDHALVVSQ